jgi:multimeric flavodoxin WrbA
MKIVIINGSPRKNGATNKILNKLIENIKNKLSDTEINHINLFEIKPEYCIGCLNCYKTGKCYNKNDKVEEIHDLMDNCDGIIMGSPTYASNVSGLFKNFHDRVHMTVEQLLYKKPCVVISTYENIIGNKTTSILKEMVLNAGGYVSGSLTIKNGFNKNPVINNENKINKVSSKFHQNL